MTVSWSLPGGMRERVLSASRNARDCGRPVPPAPEITPAQAFARAAEAFTDLLFALRPLQWRTHVLRDLDVQGLVGHLTGVERDVQRALAGDECVADADHVRSTQDLADAQLGRDPSETLTEWRRSANRTLQLVTDRCDDGSVLSMHSMRLPLGALLVVRAFELWTHENDIRTACQLPSRVPDASTLTLMTDLAVKLLPHAVARTGLVSLPAALHLVLTGAGGGTWDLPLADRAEPRDASNDLLCVVDAVDFCRLVANRIEPEGLDLHVSGNGIEGVLAAAASLALD